MGFRFRRTFRIFPGVRLNLGKKTIGLSIGGRGANATINSNGQARASAGFPGTGVRFEKSTKLFGRRGRGDSAVEPSSENPADDSPPSTENGVAT